MFALGVSGEGGFYDFSVASTSGVVFASAESGVEQHRRQVLDCMKRCGIFSFNFYEGLFIYGMSLVQRVGGAMRLAGHPSYPQDTECASFPPQSTCTESPRFYAIATKRQTPLTWRGMTLRCDLMQDALLQFQAACARLPDGVLYAAGIPDLSSPSSFYALRLYDVQRGLPCCFNF